MPEGETLYSPRITAALRHYHQCGSMHQWHGFDYDITQACVLALT
jgi:hypothetical protein